MSDENVTQAQQNPMTDDNTGTNPAPTGDQSTERTFSQADVDRLIKERLDRERQTNRKKVADQYGDYDTLKAQADELQKLKDAAKSDEEKRAEKLSELESQLAAIRDQNARLAAEKTTALVRASVVSAATRLDFVDPDDAWRYVDVTELVNEDGEVSGVEDALKAVAEAKPYLLRQARPSTIGPTNPGHGQTQGETHAQRRARLYGNGSSAIGSGAGGGGVLLPETFSGQG